MWEDRKCVVARLWGHQRLFYWWIICKQAKRVNYPPKKEKKKHRRRASWPQGPFSNSDSDFPPKKGKRPWRRELDDGELKKKKNETPTFFCTFVFSTAPTPPPNPTPDGIQKAQNAKGYYEAFRVRERHLWWMSVGFRTASCQTAASPPCFPLTCLVSQRLSSSTGLWWEDVSNTISWYFTQLLVRCPGKIKWNRGHNYR